MKFISCEIQLSDALYYQYFTFHFLISGLLIIISAVYKCLEDRGLSVINVNLHIQTC